MINLNNYSQVIYVDAINGDDTIGDGSSNNPYASVIKAVNSATLDNTLIYLKKGVYAIENGLSSTIKTDIELTFFGETVLDRDKKVIFDLQAIHKNDPKMTKQHTYIGIIFKRSNSSSDTRIYEYFYDSSILNIQFKNCVFDVGDVTPSDYIIFTGNSIGCGIVKFEYINCSIIPNNLSGKKDSKSRKGNFINCAIADSDLTTDMPNQLSSTFDYNYELINPSGEYGVYFGEYAWKRYINKTLILHDGKYEKWTKKKEYLNERYLLNMTSDTSPSPYKVSVSSILSSTYPAWKAFNGVTELTSDNERWISGDGVPQHISINFGEKRKVNYLHIYHFESGSSKIEDFMIQGSDDGVNWVTLKTIIGEAWDGYYDKKFFLDEVAEYQHYRLYITKLNSGSTRVSIVELVYGAEQEYSPSNWEVVSNTKPTLTQFVEDGMGDLSILDRQITELPPMQMEDKTSILFTNGEVGKVFSKTIDLKKYFDIRSLKVEGK